MENNLTLISFTLVLIYPAVELNSLENFPLVAICGEMQYLLYISIIVCWI